MLTLSNKLQLQSLRSACHSLRPQTTVAPDLGCGHHLQVGIPIWPMETNDLFFYKAEDWSPDVKRHKESKIANS